MVVMTMARACFTMMVRVTMAMTIARSCIFMALAMTMAVSMSIPMTVPVTMTVTTSMPVTMIMDMEVNPHLAELGHEGLAYALNFFLFSFENVLFNRKVFIHPFESLITHLVNRIPNIFGNLASHPLFFNGLPHVKQIRLEAILGSDL